MKNFKRKLIEIIIISFILIQFIILFKSFNTVDAADVYDVILFWGQSNMVGYCGTKDNEKSADTRYTHTNTNSVTAYSKKTGIETGFLTNAEQMNYVKIKQASKTVYEYKYLEKKIVEITENTKLLGEKLFYNSNSKKLESATTPYSIQESYGTNIIPEFCKTYYEKTGHKVIAVLAANGGEKIANFLPSTDGEYGDTNNQYIYEAMKEKYNAAVKYMNDNGYTIGRKLWVSFQGENDVSSGTTTDKYKQLFSKVHNFLKTDLKITKGAIILTSTKIGTARYKNVQNIYKAQTDLATENKDIILGSSYPYDRYIPEQATYESNSFKNPLFIKSDGQKMTYAEALDIASSSVCYDNNTIHFTSSALCQIGKETALKLADYTPPSLSVSYNPNTATNQDVTATITSNEELQEVSGWTLSGDKKKLTKLFKTNGSENVTVYDLSDNKASIDVSVQFIDKNPPVLSVNYSPNVATNQDVTAIITSSKPVIEPSGWKYGENNQTLTKVFKVNGSENVTVYDTLGNHASIDVSVQFIDKNAPNLSVSYSPNTATNQDVTATITSNKPVLEPSGWKYGGNNQTLTKVFKANGSENVTVYDTLGNHASIDVSVQFIDKNPPALSVSYSPNTATNQDVTATITSNKPVLEPSGWKYGGNNQTLTKVFRANGSENVTVYDTLGNHASIDVSVQFIDKDPPILSIDYSSTIATNQDVTATITSNEPVQQPTGWNIDTTKKILTKVFTENSPKAAVTVKDLVGNSASIDVEVKNIDKVAPKITVTYEPTGPTNQDVKVIITSNEKLQQLQGWQISGDLLTLTKTYTENNPGEMVTVKDLAGNTASTKIEIKNIDRDKPKPIVSYSTTKMTNKDVTVTITSNEELQELKGWSLSKDRKILTKVYTKNVQKETVIIKDLAGNVNTVDIIIQNIDKIAPKASVSYSIKEITNKDVVVTIMANEKVEPIQGWQISEDLTTLTKTYTKNNSEEIIISDLAGNTIKVTTSVTNIDKIKPEIKVDYSNKLPTNKDIVVTITSNEELQEVSGWTLSKDKKVLTKIYTENKVEETIVSDLAGNTVIVTTQVANIDKKKPEIKVSYSTTSKTDKDVVVTITSNEELQEVSGWILSKDKKTLTKTYSSNLIEDFEVYDLAGNRTKVNISVTNIEKSDSKALSQQDGKNVAEEILPYTGIKTIFLIAIIFGIISIILYKKVKDTKDII